jgi:hypothetical protein
MYAGNYPNQDTQKCLIAPKEPHLVSIRTCRPVTPVCGRRKRPSRALIRGYQSDDADPSFHPPTSSTCHQYKLFQHRDRMIRTALPRPNPRHDYPQTPQSPDSKFKPSPERWQWNVSKLASYSIRCNQVGDGTTTS